MNDRMMIELMVRAIGRQPPTKLWAYELKAREEAGESLLYFQSRAWREALGCGLRDRTAGDDDEVVIE